MDITLTKIEAVLIHDALEDLGFLLRNKDDDPQVEAMCEIIEDIKMKLQPLIESQLC